MPVLASVTGLDIEGVIVRCLILADLTDRRRGEEELADAYAELSRSAHELEEAQRIGRIGSWFWNAATDEISWSTQMFRIFGIDPTSSGTNARARRWPLPSTPRTRRWRAPRATARSPTAGRSSSSSGSSTPTGTCATP